MSFYLDWWMLIGTGVVIALLCRIFYKEDSFLMYELGTLALVVFFTFSIALFAELNVEEHGFLGFVNETFFAIVQKMYPEYYAAHPNATSAEFMFTSAEPWLKELYEANGFEFSNLQDLTQGQNKLLIFLGVAMFCTYPGWLILGVKLGFLLFGRKTGDKGVFGLP
ncbi:MAG: hypothetical protein ACOC4M_07215 [Promethearchaeia archaeon]